MACIPMFRNSSRSFALNVINSTGFVPIKHLSYLLTSYLLKIGPKDPVYVTSASRASLSSRGAQRQIKMYPCLVNVPLGFTAHLSHFLLLLHATGCLMNA